MHSSNMSENGVKVGVEVIQVMRVDRIVGVGMRVGRVVGVGVRVSRVMGVGRAE